MSNTYKTKPFWVKMRQGHLKSAEVHDHRNGPCDIPAEIDEDYWRKTHQCRRDFVYTGTHVCCCAMCHGDYGWDIEPGRRQRINGRQAVRGWDREYDSPDPLVDYQFEENSHWRPEWTL